jgi:GT2 family glycosyltransferase
VNNGLPETDSAVEEFLEDPRVVYLVSKTNEGCGGGRNIGMREVANEEFDYLFIVDSDIYVPKNWDKKMVDFMERNKKIGLAGPSTNYAGSPQLVKDCPELKTDKEIEEFALEFDKRNGHSVVPWQWPVIGFCQIIRKEVFDKVGYFDETFKLYGCEDNDYCWRIQQLGWNLAYINNIFIYHHGHGGFDLLDGSGIDQWGKNRDYFKEKHGWI